MLVLLTATTKLVLAAQTRKFNAAEKERWTDGALRYQWPQRYCSGCVALCEQCAVRTERGRMAYAMAS